MEGSSLWFSFDWIVLVTPFTMGGGGGNFDSNSQKLSDEQNWNSSTRRIYISVTFFSQMWGHLCPLKSTACNSKAPLAGNAGWSWWQLLGSPQRNSSQEQIGYALDFRLKQVLACSRGAQKGTWDRSRWSVNLGHTDPPSRYPHDYPVWSQ